MRGRGAASEAGSSSSAASARIVGAWNTLPIDSRRANTVSIARNSFATNSECPPRSKKSSVALTERSKRRSRHSAANRSSVAPRGAASVSASLISEVASPARTSATPGSGSALRSTLRLGVIGRASSGTKRDGTM